MSRAGKAKPSGHGVTQTLAEHMKYWFLLTAVGLSAVAAAAAYFGLFVVASTFGSIVLVAATLYAFLRYWPEEDAPPPSARAPKPVPSNPPPARRVTLPVVQVEGAPRARFMFALKELARRQDDFKISKQAAERFAKAIRYMLRHSA